MKSIFFFYLSWNSECGYSIWSSMRSLLLAQLPAGMAESQCDLLTFLKVSSDATQNRTKHHSWMPFMLIPESIGFQDHYWPFMHCQKIVFQQFSHSLCCVSFGAFYMINHFNSHCMLHSPCVIIRNVGNHSFISSQTETGKVEDKERWKKNLQLKSFWVLEMDQSVWRVLPWPHLLPHSCQEKPGFFGCPTERHLNDNLPRLRYLFYVKKTPKTCQDFSILQARSVLQILICSRAG